MFGPVNSAIERLDKAIEQAKEHADTAAAQALTDAKVELQRLDRPALGGGWCVHHGGGVCAELLQLLQILTTATISATRPRY